MPGYLENHKGKKTNLSKKKKKGKSRNEKMWVNFLSLLKLLSGGW